MRAVSPLPNDKGMKSFWKEGVFFLEKSVVIFWRFEMFFVCLHLERRSFRWGGYVGGEVL